MSTVEKVAWILAFVVVWGLYELAMAIGVQIQG